jgi:hypothetical protein
MPDQNPIYDFLKSNKLTDLDEKSFVNKYSAPEKAKEIHSFFVENNLTDLDSAGFYDKYLKKKVGGEEFSPTKSPSREYLSEGQELADKGFIKTEKLDPSQLVSQYKSPDISLTPKPKKNYYSDKLEKGLIFDKEGKLYEPSSEALTKAITPAEEFNLRKSTQKDLVEKSREAAVVEEPEVPIEKQGWILNMVSALDKGFAKNLISSPIKGLGTALQGITKKVIGGTGKGFISDNLIKYGDYLNNAIDELTPQDEEFKNTLWDQAAQALGQVGSLVFTGGVTGAAGKGAALVSQAPKGAAITAVKALGSQLSSPTAISAGLSMGQAEFDRAIEAGANDDQAFEAFYKNAAVGSVLETIPVMQFFKRFNNTTGGSVANYIKTKGVAGITGGIEEMTTEVLQQLYSNKTAKDIYNINQDILDGVGSSGGVGFGVGFLLNAMGANAKILRKQGKQQEADVLENQVKQYEDNIENPKVTSDKKIVAKDIVTQGAEIGSQKAVKSLDRDLTNNVITPEQYQQGIVFTEKAAQVVDKIPETVTGESRVKSMELLIERNDIKQANQILLQQKQTTDEAYHAGIDEEIKANEERIKKLDAEVYNIAKTPSKEFGTKTYVVDGEEVSKEAFEALTGKPVGTKEVIKAEVKPTEVEVTEEVKPIRQLGTGANVYFENNKYRVNDNSKGKVLLNIQGKEEGGMAIANIEFDSPKEAVEIAKELSKIYPNGIPDAVLIDKVVDNIRNRIKEEEVKPTKVKEEIKLAPIEFSKTMIGTKAMEDIIKYADENNKRIVLTPSTDFGGTSVKRLKDFYKNFGFIENTGKNKDFTTKETMYRNPEFKAIEVKEEVKVKAPTKELAEGEEVTFNTPEGKKLTGQKVTVPGFEKIDMVLVKDGLNYTVYDLASGSGLVEGDFSKEGAIESLINQFKEKNITQPKIYNLIYKGTNTSSLENKNRVPQINPSSMFESYSEKRKALEKEEYEKLPLKFNSEEIKKLKELKKRAEDFGIDKMAKEIEGAIISRAKEGTFKPKTDYYEGLLKKDIDEKIKKEAEDKGVPYPEEYMKEMPRITMDKLKTIVNEGFKKDKFESIPEDVRKIMLDGYQKNIDILNKYGYYPDEKTKVFFDKLYQYVAAQTKRENRESQIKDAKKELISALDYLNKAHEKEFGKKAEAEVKPKEGEVKVYNAKDLKANPEVLEEDENYHTINYPKSFDILYTSKDALSSKNLGNKKIGDVINIFNKDYVIADYPLGVKNKVQLIRVDKEGNLFRRQDLKGKLEKINYKDIINNPKIFQENKDEIVGNYYGMSSTKSSIPTLNKIKREIKVGDKINWGSDYVVLEVKGDKNNPDVYLADIDKDGNLIRIEAEEEVDETEQQVTKDDLKKAEAKFAAAEDKFKKARTKIEATQVKQAGMFGGEQKGMFAMVGEEAKSTLEPLRKATKEAKAELDNIKNRIKVQEVAQPELAPVEEKKESFTTKSGRQKVAYEKGQLIVRDAKTGKEVSASTRKKALDEYVKNFDFSKGKTVEELDIELPNNLNEEEGNIFIADNSSNPLELVVLYSNEPKEQRLSGKEQMIAELGIGTVDQDSFNKEMDRNFKTGGIAFSYFRKGGSTLDDIASQMEMHYGVEFTPEDIGNFMINHPRGSDAALREGESRVAKRAAERFKELTGLNLDNTLANKIIDAEMAKAEAFEQEIIKQEYETREQLEADYWKASAESDRIAEEGNRPATKKTEKTQETELAKEYKEVVGKAGKKAKENAKKDFVERNFDNIVEKLKIQIKCPT